MISYPALCYRYLYGITSYVDAEIKHENKLRWLQYQILRHSIKTNYMVNKALPHVSPLCAYCGDETGELEHTLHLFWTCRHTQKFWTDLTDLSFDIGTFLPMERIKILFGIHNDPPDSVNNFIILTAKHDIWANKFKTPHTPLSLVAFKKLLKLRVGEKQKVAEFLNKQDDLDRWNNLLLVL